MKKVTLTHKIKNKTLIIQIQVEGEIVRMRNGVLGKSMPSFSSTNHQTPANALLVVCKTIDELRAIGYEITEEEHLFDFVIFDKAKWHYDEINPITRQTIKKEAFVHTGFFVTWLVIHGFFTSKFVNSENLYNTSPTYLYEEIFDGVFSSEELTLKGYIFTNGYFDFDKGKYLEDYEEIFLSEISEKGSIFLVAPTWENYKLIEKKIDERYSKI